MFFVYLNRRNLSFIQNNLKRVNYKIKKRKSNIKEIDIDNNLYTKESPFPDVIVRSSGEKRLSDFLTWQVFWFF
jgi:undecaprenyl diphosphate synthase